MDPPLTRLQRNSIHELCRVLNNQAEL
jgi:hypothetical protein